MTARCKNSGARDRRRQVQIIMPTARDNNHKLTLKKNTTNNAVGRRTPGQPLAVLQFISINRAKELPLS